MCSSYQKITNISKILQRYTRKQNIEYCAHGMLRTSDNDIDNDNDTDPDKSIHIPKVISLLIDHWHHILSFLEAFPNIKSKLLAVKNTNNNNSIDDVDDDEKTILNDITELLQCIIEAPLNEFKQESIAILSESIGI